MLAALLRLELLLRAQLEHEALREQLEPARVLLRRALLVLLRQLERLLEARQPALEHVEQLEQLAWLQVQQVLRARRVPAQRRRVHHASPLLRRRPSRLSRKLRRLRRQLLLALMIGNAS